MRDILFQKVLPLIYLFLGTLALENLPDQVD